MNTKAQKEKAKADARLRALSGLCRKSMQALGGGDQLTTTAPQLYAPPKINEGDISTLHILIEQELTKISQSQGVLISYMQKLAAGTGSIELSHDQPTGEGFPAFIDFHVQDRIGMGVDYDARIAVYPTDDSVGDNVGGGLIDNIGTMWRFVIPTNYDGGAYTTVAEFNHTGLYLSKSGDGTTHTGKLLCGNVEFSQAGNADPSSYGGSLISPTPMTIDVHTGDDGVNGKFEFLTDTAGNSVFIDFHPKESGAVDYGARISATHDTGTGNGNCLFNLNCTRFMVNGTPVTTIHDVALLEDRIRTLEIRLAQIEGLLPV